MFLVYIQEAADKDNDERDSGFKQQKASKSQAEAGNRQAWNTLFMRPDTVAEAIAAHFKISKAELLNRDAAGKSFPHDLTHDLIDSRFRSLSDDNVDLRIMMLVLLKQLQWAY